MLYFFPIFLIIHEKSDEFLDGKILLGILKYSNLLSIYSCRKCGILIFLVKILEFD